MTPADALMATHMRLGLPSINQMPGKRWEGTIGSWRFWVNANREPIRTQTGVTVQPFQTYIEYNGWPAGLFRFDGGGQFAAGTGANPKTFASALAAWDGR